MVLVMLVFLDKEYPSEVFQTLLAVPLFSKVAVKELKAEVVVRKCSVKKGFLEISQNSLENTCARVSLLQP